MDSSLIVIKILHEDAKANERLEAVLGYGLKGIDCEYFKPGDLLSRLRGRKILFAVALGEFGINLEYYRLLDQIRREPDCLSGSLGGLVIDGFSQLHTKSVARELVFSANMAGCGFVGKPLVEGTLTLDNFSIVAQNMGTDHRDAYQRSVEALIREILGFHFPKTDRPTLLVLHASNHETSNTLAIWNKVKMHLQGVDIEEIGLRNGSVSDCAGCPYQVCLHFGEKASCFYGGPMVKEVYPAVKRANGLILLCPNYNDALSANLTAFINRLTALFRTTRFYDKALFSVVVSGYSGSDIVAQQLIAALNMNKTFYLPGNFAMLETANQAGSAMKLPGIEERIFQFSKKMEMVLKNSCVGGEINADQRYPAGFRTF